MNDREIEFAILGDNQKLMDLRVHARTGTSWKAQYALELIKTMSHGAWPTGENDKHGGGFLVRIPSPTELVDRAMALADLAVKALEERNWTVDLPHVADMIKDDGPVGFRAHVNGQGQTSTPLPAAPHAPAGDSGRGASEDSERSPLRFDGAIVAAST